MKVKKKQITQQKIRILPFAIGFFIILVLFLLFHSVRSSLFFTSKERINIVVYSQRPTVFSVNLKNAVNYAVGFYPDMKVIVPGGYGRYRLGAIGKLASLEHKPEILTQTFSAATSTLIDFYLYPSSAQVYYGSDDDEEIIFPSISEIMQMSFNASLFDRVYLMFLFSKDNQKQYKQLKGLPSEDFMKRYQGYFYHKIYRQEKKNIQIVYSKSYKTADMIGTMLEGTGIRVSDYNQVEKKQTRCILIEQSNQFSQTALDIASFFHCSLKKGKTSVYDIIFSLGDLENSWEVGGSS